MQEYNKPDFDLELFRKNVNIRDHSAQMKDKIKGYKQLLATKKQKALAGASIANFVKSHRTSKPIAPPPETPHLRQNLSPSRTGPKTSGSVHGG